MNEKPAFLHTSIWLVVNLSFAQLAIFRARMTRRLRDGILVIFNGRCLGYGTQYHNLASPIVCDAKDGILLQTAVIGRTAALEGCGTMDDELETWKLLFELITTYLPFRGSVRDSCLSYTCI